MGFQSIFNQLRASGSWGQLAGKLRQSTGDRSSHNGSSTPSFSRSSAASDDSFKSGDSWTSSVSSMASRLQEDAFTVSEQKIIRQEMARCRYGLGWQWLNPKNKIRLRWTPDGAILFSGYHAKKQPAVCLSQTEALRMGDCQQLASQLGRNLSQRFQGKYKFYMVRGNYPESPWRVHYFLMGWPAREEAYFLGKTRGALHPFTRQPTTRIPKEAFLIDPTYQLMGHPANHDRLCDYYAMFPQFEDTALKAGPKNKVNLIFSPSDGLTSGFPLGFARDLQPNHSNPGAVGYAFLKQGAVGSGLPSQQPKLSLKFGWDDQPCQNWRQAVPLHTPLYQMLNRLEAEALKASQKQSSATAAALGCFQWV